MTKEEALQEALFFLSSKDTNATIEEYTITGKAEMYKVITEDGWVLVSTETSIKPILAFSRIDDFPTIEDMPEGMKWLFSYYEEAIYYAEQHSQELSHINVWDKGNRRNKMSPSPSDTILLSRLTEVEWGQSGNNNLDSSCDITYNKYCPPFYSVYCDKTVVGCGAVALGQVLWFYQWPYYGWIPQNMLNDQGLVSEEKEYRYYDWNLMPNKLFYTTPMVEVDMVASLLRDCGYAEKTHYGSTGSNTNIGNIENALINNFGYTNAQKISRSTQPTNWVSRMKNELSNGRPVIYRGADDDGNGHFFVLRGFTQDYFSINWGWKGLYNHVWCTLDSLYYSQYNHYHNGQWAIINIEPTYPSCSTITIPSTDVWETNFLIQNGGGINVGNRTIIGAMKGAILSGEYVKLTSGFKTTAGARVFIAVKDMHCNDRGSVIVPNNDHFIHHSFHNNENSNITPQNTKFLRDGQLFILRGDKIFNASGIQVK